MRRQMHSRGKQAGFNLIDLLIGMTISLFGLLAVAVVFRDFGQQRTTQTQASESQTNGTLALYLIERDLGQAGYGMMGLQNCPYINYYYNGGGHFSPPSGSALPGSGTNALTTLPVRIYDGGSNSDTVEVQFGSSVSGVTGAEITSAVTYPGGYAVQSAVGFANGDKAVANAGGNCTLITVTNTDPVASPIEHANSDPYNTSASPGGTGWNSVTAANLSDTPKPFLVNLGNFVSRRYQVAATGTASSLTLAELPSFTANTVVDDIVFLKAQYGLSATATSTTVSSWVDGSTAIDNTNAANVIAVRIGVVARSPLYEKDVVAANTTLSVLPPTTGTTGTTVPNAGTCGTIGGTMEVRCTVPNQHYRYRTYSTIIPLKNVIWTR